MPDKNGLGGYDPMNSLLAWLGFDETGGGSFDGLLGESGGFGGTAGLEGITQGHAGLPHAWRGEFSGGLSNGGGATARDGIGIG